MAPTYSVSETNASRYELFSYLKHYTKSVLFVITHIILLCTPSVLILACEKPRIYFFVNLKKMGIQTESLFVETLVLVTVTAFLPGLLLSISGGSAFYFIAPVFFISFILLLALEVPQKIFYLVTNRLPKIELALLFNSRDVRKWNVYAFFACFICIACMVIRTEQSTPIQTIKGVFLSRLDNETILSTNRIDKLRKVFHPSEILENNDYKMLAMLRNISKKNKNEYCIFMKNDNKLINLYDYYTEDYDEPAKLIYPYLAVSAYTGLPIINAMYIKGDRFFRGDDVEFGECSDCSGYSIPPKICGDKVTLKNMVQIATDLNKEYIAVLGKDTLEIVPVQTKK